MELNKHYKDLLAYYIKKNKLTLRQIAYYCEEKGQKIAPSYISKLQNGHLPPPSEDVSRVLAEVLNGDPETLIFLGYIEKAPSIIRQKLTPVYDETPYNVYSLACRMVSLSPKYREKIISELQWLEKLDGKEP